MTTEMLMTQPGVCEYIGQLEGIAGWFTNTDANLFAHVLAVQPTEGVSGDLLEIGCFLGKSAILMGYGTGDDRLVICDLFGDITSHRCAPYLPEGAAEVYATGDASRFLHNWDLFHRWRPELYACDSLYLEPHIEGRSFRFVHIDGCHSYLCAQHDIALALSHAAPGCVIAIDDWRCHRYPAVGRACWGAVDDGRLHPFALTEDKLYACAESVHARAWTDWLRWLGEVETFPDFEAVRLSTIPDSVRRPWANS